MDVLVDVMKLLLSSEPAVLPLLVSIMGQAVAALALIVVWECIRRGGR